MKPSRALLRLLALLIVCFGVIGLSPLGVLFLAVGIAAWVLAFQRDILSQLLQRIWRLRWFFLAIGILYGLGSPAEQRWLALEQGLHRIGILAVLVSVVGLSLHGLSSQELARGLVGLLKPLSYLKFPVETFARRLALALNSVDLMDQKLRSMPRKDKHQTLNSIAQLCWAAENWVPSQPSDNFSEHQPEISDFALFSFFAVLILSLQWLT